MKTYDLAQEVFTCQVYQGDPTYCYDHITKIMNGEFDNNLSKIYTCIHNGLNVEAPYHFYSDGTNVEELPLDAFTGPVCVFTYNGMIDAMIATEIFSQIEELNIGCEKRILIKGKIEIKPDGAKEFARLGVVLLGIENHIEDSITESIQDSTNSKFISYILLKQKMSLMHGINLSNISDGVYILNAAPLKFGGTDGSPMRPILVALH